MYSLVLDFTCRLPGRYNASNFNGRATQDWQGEVTYKREGLAGMLFGGFAILMVEEGGGGTCELDFCDLERIFLWELHLCNSSSA